MEVKMYATNLAKKPDGITPVYKDEWRISETNLLPNTSAICRYKTDHSLLKPIENYEESSRNTDLCQIRVIRVIQMEEMSRLGWLMDLAKHVT
jgi:hypothetical protein